MNNSRRKFLGGAAMLGAGSMAAARAGQRPVQAKENTMISTVTGAPVRVQTPDVEKLPWTLDNGVKVFQLTAEVVRRELLPGRALDLWGYNGSVPGKTIEVNEGDHVRILFRNNLPEPTSIHWHGLEVPYGMDGVPALNQPLIQPGGSFTYEFTLNQNGTFFYHSHMAMQEMMGMLGFFIIHPKSAYAPKVDADFGIILQEFAALPNNTVPNSLSMEFNWVTFNGKAGPDTTPLIVRLGDRVRIRFVNLGMDHHPIHLHGQQFHVTGTEGGRIPETAWYPGNTVLIGVAQARDIEFNAVRQGDWMLHCHLPHHMMNQMVSMVGPMAHGGMGMPTGHGMPEGMGIVRGSNATSSELGPSLGRGTGLAKSETETSNIVGQDANHTHDMQGMPGIGTVYTCPVHPEIRSDKPGKCPICGATLIPVQETGKMVPGYPQDMWMTMDKEVEKPETYGLPAGWTGAMMGMMTLVRVLPPDMYEKVMSMVKGGRPKKGMEDMSHHEH